MADSGTIRVIVSRASGASPELIEQTARSLLVELNAESPGTADFASVPAEQGNKQSVQLTAELVIGVSGVASAWIVPAIQHWWKRQAPDAGLTFKAQDFEVHVKGNAPPEVFAKVTEAIKQVTKD